MSTIAATLPLAACSPSIAAVAPDAALIELGNEFERIVAQLDDAFARLDDAQRQLDKFDEVAAPPALRVNLAIDRKMPFWTMACEDSDTEPKNDDMLSYRVLMWTLVCKYDPDNPPLWCLSFERWAGICQRVLGIADAWREWQAHRRLLPVALRVKELEQRCIACEDARNLIVDKILKAGAQSIAGLRVKALLTLDECKREHWNEEGTSEALIGKHLAESILQISSRTAS